jgi:hypothetical protein
MNLQNTNTNTNNTNTKGISNTQNVDNQTNASQTSNPNQPPNQSSSSGQTSQNGNVNANISPQTANTSHSPTSNSNNIKQHSNPTNQTNPAQSTPSQINTSSPSNNLSNKSQQNQQQISADQSQPPNKQRQISKNPSSPLNNKAQAPNNRTNQSQPPHNQSNVTNNQTQQQKSLNALSNNPTQTQRNPSSSLDTQTPSATNPKSTLSNQNQSINNSQIPNNTQNQSPTPKAQATNKQSTSPQSSTNSTKPSIPNKISYSDSKKGSNKLSKKRLITIGVIGLIVIIIGGTVIFAFSSGLISSKKTDPIVNDVKKLVGMETDDQSTQSPSNSEENDTDEANESGSEDTDQTDMLAASIQKLNNNLYKITDKGKIEYSYYSEFGSSSSSSDFGTFDDSTLYLDKGKIKAGDETQMTEATTTRFLQKDGKGYLVSDEEKSYFTFDGLLEFMRQSYPLTAILESYKEDKQTFEKQENDIYKWNWQIQNNFSSASDSNQESGNSGDFATPSITVITNIHIDPETKLITKIIFTDIKIESPEGSSSSKPPEAEGQVTYKYEEIDSIPEELRTIPEDYTDISNEIMNM